MLSVILLWETKRGAFYTQRQLQYHFFPLFPQIEEHATSVEFMGLYYAPHGGEIHHGKRGCRLSPNIKKVTGQLMVRD